MAPPAAQKEVNPPQTLPADFFDKQGNAPDTLPADFDFGQESKTSPKGEIRPAETGVGPWLRDVESDLRGGGSRTAIGRGLGILQGRGDKGMSGLESGTSPETANLMGSIPLGAVHTAQGIQETPEHPIKGPLKAIGGIGEMATIPGMVMGGPVAHAALEAIPDAGRAAATLEDIRAAAANVPVRPTATWEPLSRFQELTQAGGSPARATSQLSNRLQNLIRQPQLGEVKFPEARDFYSNISRQSSEEAARLNDIMRHQMGNVRSGLHQDLTRAAGEVGRGEDYANAIKEYRQAKRIEDFKNTIKGAGVTAAKYAIPAGIGGYFLRDLIPKQ